MLIEDQKTIDTYYRALLERDQSYVGIFYVGVKTTSIFCLSTCHARKPKRQNVLFYTSIKEALDEGFRPCKLCKPTENAHQTPPQVIRAIELMKLRPKEKIKDHQLRQHEIRPEMLRRWFKKHYGLTFHAYQRMYRINNAFEELKKGKKTSDAAYDTGYESLSGFGYTYKKLLGGSPQQTRQQGSILINRLTTPLGPMFVCATDKGICLLEFVDRRMLETEFKDLQRLLKAAIIIGENKHIVQAKKEIGEYFDGNRTAFTVPLDTPGTDFQNIVWQALLKIPYGATSTYLRQAERIKKPTAVRAVASANGYNRISIIVPCHRVIGSDGALRGYGGGLERKRWLLEHEAKVLNTTQNETAVHV